jgi:conflict system pore-forming effector with SLATT domain/uncharacterized protein DUF4231
MFSEEEVSMATQDGGKVASKLNREVLLQSWARLSVYDHTASSLKNKFIQRRNWVIGLTLTATIASVLTAIMGETTLAVVLALMSIALPVAAALLMNDLIKFTGRTAWIKYRYIAEMMRMHIYLYRTQAGDYAGPIEKMDTKLSDNLEAVIKDVKLDDGVPLSGQEPTDPEQIIAAINQANAFTKGDDGLSEISVENYINWRIDNQRGWYKSKIDEDFARLKFFARSAQVFLGVGALVSALAAGASIDVRLVTLVAVTNAISVALNQWSEVSLVGKTHSIFQIAWDQLGNLKRYWSSIQDDLENQDAVKRATEFANLAQRVENVLLWERQEWYEMALQTEANSDKAILGDLTRLTERAQDAQKKP